MKIVLSLITILFLTSCQSNKKDESDIISPEDSYAKGLELFKAGDYKEAADEFDKIYFQYPGHKITPYAEIMEAYSFYHARKYDDAIDVIDNFIAIHPSHEDISYAYYLKGLSYYMQISDVHHDQGRTEQAKNIFLELKNMYPNTKYATDASLKLDLIYDHLAGKEMQVGRYNLNRSNPIGAINRFQSVIEKYETSTHTPEALYRLVESFKILGINEEANKYAAVLGHNYPDSKWFIYARNILNRE